MPWASADVNPTNHRETQDEIIFQGKVGSRMIQLRMASFRDWKHKSWVCATRYLLSMYEPDVSAIINFYLTVSVVNREKAICSQIECCCCWCLEKQEKWRSRQVQENTTWAYSSMGRNCPAQTQQGFLRKIQCTHCKKKQTDTLAWYICAMVFAWFCFVFPMRWRLQIQSSGFQASSN